MTKARRLTKKSFVFIYKVFKWPVLIAVPLLVFAISAWWSLISSLSSEVQTVPDLVGKTQQEARFLLSSRGLDMLRDDAPRFSQVIDRGLILAHSPTAGTKIKRGRNVKVKLSAGFRRVLVPNLVMKSIREAELIARQKGLKLRERDSVYSDSIPPGRIIAQDPEPSSAFLTENIEVISSRGPAPKQVMVPDFEGRPLLPVLQFLRENGFKVTVRARGGSGDISYRDPFELRSYTIYRQSPAAGTFVYLMSPETIILRVERRR